jgi:alginate O-acetyltransferase complex protein AlgJ
MMKRELWALCWLFGFVSCHPQASRYPWESSPKRALSTHADVRTLNADYKRQSSGVLVREVVRPTRAALDYAAYHANFMIAEDPPEGLEEGAEAAPNTANPFADWVEKGSLQADIEKTPLSQSERERPYAFAPLVEYLRAKKVAGAAELEELGSQVREEAWGVTKYPGSANQTIAELFIHEAPQGAGELWVKIEFQPWFQALGALPDQDGDGVPEVYGKVESGKIQPSLISAIHDDYGTRLLAPGEVKTWANQLASYWYPSYNTDLVAPGPVWPDDHTEPEIKRELKGRSFAAPTVIVRGKPRGKPTYNLFLVKGSAGRSAAAEAHEALTLAKTRPTPELKSLRETIERELAAQGGGSWEKWTAELAPLHGALRKRLKGSPKAVKAFAGKDGYLFFRNSLDFVVGGDLERQAKAKNPLPIIVAFKNELEKLGVDFLFVPVPTKVEVFPDQLEPQHKALAGQIINPYSRKFLLSLTNSGVEVVDLLTPFLAARSAAAAPGLEPLYQHQDTHWTDRGLRLAADRLAARIKKYGWYKELSRHSKTFSSRQTQFTRFGDLHAKLPDAQKRGYQPETLRAEQVVGPDGALYEDDPESPIVVLGDSFTGVYELTDAEHAGVSAHIAKNIGYPVDLVMSYGGGPNVRNQLMRRGKAALAKKKLVIWMMTSRDLYNYWDDWKPLDK